jgi:HNH endonuclease
MCATIRNVSRADGRQWIDRCGHRTYEICKSIADFTDSLGRIDFREIEDLTLDDWLIGLVPAWQRDSVIHRLAERFITKMFLAETSGPYISRTDIDPDTGSATFTRVLTVDFALAEYGISVESFDFPEAGPSGRRQVGDRVVIEEDHSVADACYDYFTNDLMWSEPYAQLVDRMADEVFHVLFADRGVLAAVNAFVSAYVESACLSEAYPQFAHLFTTTGRLRRSAIPQRVKRAVFHRERGRCAECGNDLSWVLDSLAREHFDHVVPLAQGGLNDVTNIQLLCASCNLAKAGELKEPRLRYRRWLEV